jgi:tetratricopeptide (TPR) repeat protein
LIYSLIRTLFPLRFTPSLRWFFGTVVLLLSACSVENNNFISKAYHNTTARYNAYFYAKERIREVEKIIEKNHVNDYDKVLFLFPKTDSTLAASYQSQIEDAIKKSSIAIQFHKNSQWVDDAYIMVGRARHYSLDYVNAIQTYKYVNKTSDEVDTRHESLIRLHRAYTDYEEFANAGSVAEYLGKETLNNRNLRLFYLNRAHYYQTRQDLDNMIKYLDLSAPLLRKKDGKAKVHFIMGQIYQELGFDAYAFENYKKCISANPPYELDFYARLNMAQVSRLSKGSDVRETQKRFKKLLADKKNLEYKDKIYFMMGEYEARRGNLAKAIENYHLSLREGGGNRQKSKTYLRLGVLHYDTLKQYETAKYYYDSTMSILDKDHELYAQSLKRKEVLDEFLKNYQIVTRQDSLIRLAEMDSVQLMSYLQNVVDEKTKEAELLAELAKKNKPKKVREPAVDNRPTTAEGSGITGSNWYFGNQQAMAQGEAEFVRRWGKRPLEDNWRRSVKEIIGGQPTASGAQEKVSKTDEGKTEAGPAIPTVTELMASLPRGKEQIQSAKESLEEAYYALGIVYQFELLEHALAGATFESLLNKFPDTQNEPEVLYLLHFIFKEIDEGKSTYYKNLLLSKHPHTRFAKLIINPNFSEEGSEYSEQLKKVYAEAYQMYKDGYFNSASALVKEALEEYPELEFTARLRLLRVLLIGKTEDISVYQYHLDTFIKQHPDSDITPYAVELLEASRNFKENEARRRGSIFVKDFSQPHYLVVVYPTQDISADELSILVKDYNIENFKELGLVVSNLVFNDQNTVLMVTEFAGIESSLNYLRKFDNEGFFPNSNPIKIHKFVITKDNFTIFYQMKELEGYQRFFEENYKP